MPTFDSLPPADVGRSGLRLLRTPPISPLIAHVLSENLTGCRTHFVGNRTIPCEAPNCDPCESGIAWRWHGYLAVIIDATQETVLFETTATAAAAFAQYFQRYGTTRGAHFKAARLNQRPNGRVLIQAKPADLAKINLPPAPNVQKLLCHIWNIPENQIEQRDSMPRPPHKDLTIHREHDELDQPALQPGRFPGAAVRPSGNGETRIEPTGV